MATQVITFIGGGLQPAFDAEDALPLAVRLKPSLVYPQGCLIAESVGTPGTFGPYDTTNADVNVAKGVLRYGCATDASSNVTFGSQPGGGEWGEQHGSALAYFSGYFRTEDLPQAGAGKIDAGAVAQLGKLIEGTTAAGILRIS